MPAIVPRGTRGYAGRIPRLGSDYAVAAAYQSAFLVFEQCELPVFADGFESGDTSHWSLTVP